MCKGSRFSTADSRIDVYRHLDINYECNNSNTNRYNINTIRNNFTIEIKQNIVLKLPLISFVSRKFSEIQQL